MTTSILRDTRVLIGIAAIAMISLFGFLYRPEETQAAVPVNLSNLSAGWTEIPNTKYPGHADEINAWATAAFTGDSLIIAAMGGHASFASGDVWRFDLSTETWIKDRNGGTIIGRTGGEYDQPIVDYGPTPRHGYSGVEWFDNIKRLFVGGLYFQVNTVDTSLPIISDTNNSLGTWYYDPATKTYTSANDILPQAASVLYDPVRGLAFMYDNYYRTNSIYVFDPVQRKILKTIPFSGYFILHQALAYGDGKIVWFAGTDTGAQTLSIIDVSDLNNVKQTLYNLTPSIPIGNGWDDNYPPISNPPTISNIPNAYMGFQYYPPTKKFVAWTGGPDVIWFDPNTLTLTRQTFSNGPTASSDLNTGSAGIFGKWRYMPQYDAFIGYESVFQNVWIFKPTSSSQPSPTLNFAASPTSISSGSSITLTWSSTNATSCSAGGGWSGTKGSSGSQTVAPTVSTTYTLSCTGSAGISVTQNAVVTVAGSGGNSGGSGPVVQWSLDGAGNDSSGNGNTLSLLNSPATISGGAVGQALSFNGVNQYGSITSNFGLNTTNPSETISLWFKTTAANGILFDQHNSVNPGTGATSYSPPLAVISGKLRAELWNGTVAGITSTSNVNDGTWHHAAIIGNGSTQSLYLDGTLVGSRSGTIDQTWWTNTTIATGYDGVRFGIAPGGWLYFNGSLDDVRVYNRALSASEIQTLFSGGNPSAGGTVTPAPTLTFTASPSSITSGNSSTLTWSSTNATACTASGGWSGTKGSSGSQSVSPTSNTTYSLQCTGAGGSVTQSTSITVSATSVPASGPAVADTMTISNSSGTTQNNYPLQFARPFLQGEIQNYPLVLVNGSPVTTQADVKERWSDGSVKHALISIIIPSIPSSGTVTLSFQNQSSGNNTALTQAQMLGSNFDFDAQIKLTNGSVTKSASARTMLSNGDYKYWASGPVATTILLSDDTVARKYDLGFDSYKPFRPRFEATFWPSLNKVFVRYIGENTNTTELEDLTYNLTLTLGNSSPQTVYTQNAVNQYAATRWTEDFWLGGTPEKKININHNLAYLRQTPFFPYYDTSISVPESAIAGWYSTGWSSGSLTINSAGNWDTYMPSTGGRSDIGPMPTWTALWLYTGDWRMRDLSLANADLAGTWQMNYREGDPTKNLLRTDAAGAGTGLGKILSLTNRKSLWIAGADSSDIANYMAVGDRLKFVGANVGSGWTWDLAHQPDAYYEQYVLTGDPFYLDGMYFWASASSVAHNPALYRGPTGAEGGIFDQVRGNGWAFRNRVEAAYASPDGTPEKTYFNTLIDDAIAAWEGTYNVSGGHFTGNAEWTWAKNRFGPTYSNNPLHFSYGESNIMSPWMHNFWIFALGFAHEMGYQSDAVLSWASVLLTGTITDPSFNPYMVSAYQIPAYNASGWYQTWGAVKSASDPSLQIFSALASITDTDHGYGLIATAAGSFVTGESNGAATWNWLKTNGYDKAYSSFPSNPKWAILPRVNTTGSTAPTGSNPTPPPVQTPAPTVTLTTSISSITSGQSATLTWSSTNATACTASGGWSGTKGAAGSQSVSPTTNTTYTLTCVGNGGSKATSVSVSVSAPVGILQVGPTRTYTLPSQAIAAAQNGNTIEIDAGTYVDCAIITKDNLTIKGVGGRPVIKDKVCSQKGIFVNDGDNITFENLELSGMTGGEGNEAGIRQEGLGLTVRNVYMHDGYEGILTGASNADSLTIENSRFENLGNDGFEHGIYAGVIGSLTVKNSEFISMTGGGHEIKSRALNNTITCNLIGSLGGDDSRAIDLPNGGTATIRNNIIEEGPISENHEMIGFGMENTTAPMTLSVLNNIFITDYSGSAVIRPVSTNGATTVTFTGNTMVGNTFTSTNVTTNGFSGASINETGTVKQTSRSSAGYPAYSASKASFPNMPSSWGCGSVGLTVSGGQSTPAPSLTFFASASNISAGTPVTLTWTATNATSCTASNGWSGTKGASGSQNVSPTSNTTYALSCTGAGGTTNQSLSVTVGTSGTTGSTSGTTGSTSGGGGGPVTAPPTADSGVANTSGAPFVSSLSASAGTITNRQLVKLTWVSGNTEFCSASASPETNQWAGRIGSTGSQEVGPLKQTTTLKVTCFNSKGDSASQSITVNVSDGTATTPPAGSTSGGPMIDLPRPLKSGDSGEDVKALQVYLSTLGLLSSDNTTGYFGPLTTQAVIAFQEAHRDAILTPAGLNSGTGIVGPSTIKFITGGTAVVPTSSPTPTTPTTPVSSGSGALTRALGVGSRSNDVVTLQNFLITKGYLEAGNNTGYFGTLTRGAVQKYQCAINIVCSGSESSTGYGSVGPSTRSHINAELGVSVPTSIVTPTQPVTQTQPATPSVSVDIPQNSYGFTRSLSQGMSGKDVETLQKYLAAPPYNGTSQSGIYDYATVLAVQRFQSLNGVISSGPNWGVFGPRTIQKFNEVFGN